MTSYTGKATENVVGKMVAILFRLLCANSLAPGKFEWNFRHVIFKQILVIDGWGICRAIALIWMSLDFTDDQSTLVQVMAWCRQATSHYLSQCWPRSFSPYGVTRAQCVKELSISVLLWMLWNFCPMEQGKECIVISKCIDRFDIAKIGHTFNLHISSQDFLYTHVSCSWQSNVVIYDFWCDAKCLHGEKSVRKYPFWFMPHFIILKF